MVNGIYIFDIFVLVLLLYGLVSGLFRGFFKEIGSLVGLALAFLITFKFGDNIVSIVKNQSMLAPYAEYVGVVAYVILFLIILILVNLGTSFLLFFVFKIRNVKLLNRIGGLIVGLIKGWAVAVIIYFLLISFGAFMAKYVEDSRSAPYLQGPAKKMQVMASDVLSNQSFRNVIYPEVPEVPPPPQLPEDWETSAGSSSGTREAPMYIPPDDETLFNLESFE